MADADIVRTTRSGDRFHYLWASLRALRLLDSTSDLVAISVEGPIEGESVPSEEIIDVAEYFGESPDDPTSRVHYHQLKHSSVRIGNPITSSELSKTLSKFADIYRAAFSEGNAATVQFSFVTNRHLNIKVRQTLADLRAGRPPSHTAEGQYLRARLGLERIRAPKSTSASN